ncbi:MAG: hypothetical protein R3244_12930 [Thermoanaerobaculia bacterium]|nr:hypothetical protein [Thermoanaerobaculia bacterium]
MGLNLDIHPSEATRIEELIADPESPVGIDAKKTHILILQKLLDIEARLEVLERFLDR